MKTKLIYVSASLILLMYMSTAVAQNTPSPPFSISGTAGVQYEHYGLDKNPASWTGYLPRRPWNQLRFNFNPTMKFGKNFSLPFNFNFATKPTNFAGPYAGLEKQSFGQFLTNPMNNFGINPKYKWAEALLGTQYIKYSDLSTGDIGIFGAGVDLRPKNFLIKFFTGTSQQAVDYAALPLPGVTGAYKRTHYMFQLGIEKENNYKAAFNFSKGKDKTSSVTSAPLTVKPQEGITMSLILEKYTKKGWFIKSEVAESVFTKDLTQPFDSTKSLKPFIDGRTSTVKDWAAEGSLGKKSKNFDIAYATKYIGAGFQTTGYPFLQNDHWDNTINTRIVAWKSKMNIVASVGTRTNNLSSTSTKSDQFIGNINWFTQFDDHFSLNLNYNNFGFSAASGINPYGIKNVSNDLGISPTFTWNNTKMSHMITMSYNYSKYDERDVITGLTTSNATHTALITYIPTWFNSEVSPDFSILYFNNTMPLFKNTLTTFSSSVSLPALKKKMQLRGQLQYTIGKVNSYSSNKNLIASLNADYNLSKKLTWNAYITTNHFKYGNELVPPASLEGANYLETTVKTGLKYKF